MQNRQGAHEQNQGGADSDLSARGGVFCTHSLAKWELFQIEQLMHRFGQAGNTDGADFDLLLS